MYCRGNGSPSRCDEKLDDAGQFHCWIEFRLQHHLSEHDQDEPCALLLCCTKRILKQRWSCEHCSRQQCFGERCGCSTRRYGASSWHGSEPFPASASKRQY